MQTFLVTFKWRNKRFGEYVIAKNGFDALATAAQANHLPCVRGCATAI